MTSPLADKARSEPRFLTTTTTEYGIREDFPGLGGDVHSMPEWQSVEDVVAAMHGIGRTAFTAADVLVRTTTVTVTDWEAAS